jgi:hypothetical protein
MTNACFGGPAMPAVSLGLSANDPDDREMLAPGLIVYDALYTRCRSLAGGTHGWPPQG